MYKEERDVLEKGMREKRRIITHMVGECEMYKEERDVLVEETREIYGSDMEEFDTLDSREKTIAILRDRWWPQTAKEEGKKTSKKKLCNIWKQRSERPNCWEVPLVGVGTVLRLARDAWSMFIPGMTRASNQ